MKILITGGGGFLGLHVASYLNKKGNKLTLVDIQKFNETEYPRGATLATCDVRDNKELEKLIKGQDVVIHAAAALPLWKKEDIYTTNVNGTGNVLELARKYGVKRVIFISSTAVYGVPKKHPIIETDPRIGVGAYGKSKILAEDLCFKAIEKGQHVTIIRPKTFVGTGRLGVFEILFDWIHDGKRIPIIGKGENRYQLLDVDDLVSAIYLFCQPSFLSFPPASPTCASPKASARRELQRGERKRESKSYDGVFNIGAEKLGTVKEDLGELFKHAKSGSRILPTPAFIVKKALFLFEKLKVSPLYQWVYDTADKDSFVSIEKIKKTLNWKPRYSNAEALIKSYRWYLENYNQIKSKTSGVTHTVGWKQGILRLFKYIA